MGILRDSGYLIGSNVILLFTSLASGILTARLLGPAGRGELYLVLQVASLGSLLLAAGLGPSYQYHLSKQIFKRSLIVSHMLLQTGLVAVLVILLNMFGKPVLFKVIGSSLSDILLMMTGVAIILNVEILFGNSILMSLPQGIKVSSILGVASSAVYVLLLVILLWSLQLGVMGAVCAYLMTSIVKLIPIMRIITKGIWRELSLAWLRPSRLLFSFGISAFLANIMVSSVFRIDVFIVNALVGVKAVGIYSIAVAFAELALLVPSAVGTSLFTHLPSASDDDQLAILERSSRIVIALASVIGMTLSLISYPLVTLLMGKTYIDAVVPLCLLMPGLIAMSTNYVFSNYYAARGRPLISAGCFGLGLFTNVVINYAVIPLYGINGAAMASTIAYGLITGTFVMLLKRQHSLSLKRLMLLNREDLSVIRQKLSRLNGRFNKQAA